MTGIHDKHIRYEGTYMFDPELSDRAKELMWLLMQYPIGTEVSIALVVEDHGLQESWELVAADFEELKTRKYILDVITPENVAQRRAALVGYVPPPLMTKAEHDQIIREDWRRMNFTPEEIEEMTRKWLD